MYGNLYNSYVYKKKLHLTKFYIYYSRLFDLFDKKWNLFNFLYLIVSFFINNNNFIHNEAIEFPQPYINKQKKKNDLNDYIYDSSENQAPVLYIHI